MRPESLYITRERKKYWNKVQFLTYATLGTSEFDSRYRWNPELGTTGRYIDLNGQIVKQEIVTNQLEIVIGGLQSDMIALALDLQDGKISTQQWYNTFKSQIKTMHGVSSSLAKGGWAQMRDDDWQVTKNIVENQMGFLNKFAEGIDKEEVKLDGNFLKRVDQYVAASRSTGEEIRRHTMADKATHEKRVLGPADHCHTDDGLEGCWELFKLGWQLIGTLPAIGQTPCRNNCHCTFVFGIFNPALGTIQIIR